MTDAAERSAVRRRTILATIGTTAGVVLAGCNSGTGDGSEGGGGGDGGSSADGGSGGGGDNTVVSGPDGSFVFEPEELTVSTGATVTWTFASPSHNVSAWPEMHEKVSIPDGAAGFGTMEKGGDRFETVPEDETFEHTFETAGEYTYVCVPHAGAGMVGTVVVE